MNNRKGDGNSISHTAAGTILSGEAVVLGSAGLVSVGVSAGDLLTGEVGEVAITGVFDMLAVTGAAFEAGETVDYDSALDLVDDNASTLGAGDVGDFGIAMETVASAGAGSRIKIKLLPGNGIFT
jgi:predicted RecA/RadA family phage recombinase